MAAVVVEGVDRVQAGLHTLARDLTDPAAADAEAARIIATSTRPPVRTGQLARSITVLPGPGARVGTYVRYARFTEARSHWLRRAVEGSQTQWVAAYTRHATSACEAV